MATRTAIAIDFGTAATGYCFALTSPTSTSPVNARILPFKPGDRASQATEKNLTAILLEASTLNAVAFGREARRRFFDMDQAEQKNFAFFSQFKMALSSREASSTPLEDRTVHGEGADVAVPLITVIAKVLDFIRVEALDRARSMALELGSIAWVLTVPAIWDERKCFAPLVFCIFPPPLFIFRSHPHFSLNPSFFCFFPRRSCKALHEAGCL